MTDLQTQISAPEVAESPSKMDFIAPVLKKLSDAIKLIRNRTPEKDSISPALIELIAKVQRKVEAQFPDNSGRVIKFLEQLTLNLERSIRGRASLPAGVRTKVYSYKGLNPAGEEVNGIIESVSRGKVQYELEESGVTNLSITVKQPLLQMEFGKTVSGEDLLQVTRQLSSFAQAGIPAARGLSILASTTENKVMRGVLEELVLEIEGGATLSESVSHYPHVFPTYYGTILNAAERSGDLPGALETLNSYLERDLRSKRAVKSAMTYPIVLILLTILAVSVLSLVVLPKFEVFFASLDVELPLTTRILLGTTRFLGNFWWALLILAISLVAGFIYMYKKPEGRLKIDAVMLKLPLFGSLIQLIALERFCRVLSTLVRTNVPLPDALTLAGRASNNTVFERGIKNAHAGVLNGEGLATPLEREKIFPIAAIQILRVGEESGRLENQMEQAASYYADELDHRMKNLTALIEPVTLLFLGGGVGFVAVALVSAMYGIYSGVQA
ncbi:MAG: type II secretion system F family protein [Actinomycetes bacterium]|jgi:type IV pilus assembly protein PilC